MIETIILDKLLQLLPVQTFLEAPEHKPGSYVILQKTGSRRLNRIDQATFALQSIAPSMEEAAALNETVKAAMDQLPELCAEVFRAERNGDYNFTDTSTKERRYQAVYIITYKE